MMHDIDRLLKKSFDDITIDRGRAYAESGAVVDLKDSAREIVALVSGTRRSPYRVLVPRSRSSGLPEPGNAVCTCPMVIRCKHIVATILTYYGDVPWGSFEATSPKLAPAPRGRTTKEILGEIERLVTRPVQQTGLPAPHRTLGGAPARVAREQPVARQAAPAPDGPTRALAPGVRGGGSPSHRGETTREGWDGGHPARKHPCRVTVPAQGWNTGADGAVSLGHHP